MTKHGAIAEAERRVRVMPGKSYNISRQVHARDYIVQTSDRPLPSGYILVATVASDGLVTEHRTS